MVLDNILAASLEISSLGIRGGKQTPHTQTLEPNPPIQNHLSF